MEGKSAHLKRGGLTEASLVKFQNVRNCQVFCVSFKKKIFGGGRASPFTSSISLISCFDKVPLVNYTTA